MASKAHDTRPKNLINSNFSKIRAKKLRLSTHFDHLHGNMATSDGIAGVQKYEVWYNLFKKNCLKGGGRKKVNPSWGFHNEFEGKSLWFYCVVCYAKEPRLDLKLKRQPAGILKYDKSKSLLKLHKLEKVNSHEYFSKLIEKFFDYVIAADNKKYFFQEQSFITDVTETDYILPDILQVGLTDERESSFSRVHRDFASYKNLVKQYFSSGKDNRQVS